MDKQQEIESAVFRKLLKHLDEHKDVQNIELMILADFCRNCLAKWMVTASEDVDIALDYETAREKIYGMPYTQWKDQYQTKATAEQLTAFNEKRQLK